MGVRRTEAVTRPRAAVRAQGLLIGLAVVALLAFNVQARLEGADLASLLPGWRGWDDLAIAVGHRVHGLFPVAPYGIENQFRRRDEAFAAFSDRVTAMSTAPGVSATRFWAAVSDDSLRDLPPLLVRRFDDSGRARLLALGFDALGGVAPFLLPWLAVLITLPILLWGCAELVAAKRPWAALVFGLAVASSSFVVDMLVLGYSAVGFYVAGALLTLPMTVYAFSGRPTVRGLLWRSAATGVLLGLTIICRSACWLFVPALVLATAVAAWRATSSASDPRRRRRAVAGLALASLFLLLLPQRAFEWRLTRESAFAAEQFGLRRRPPIEHDVWITLWQGFGDFDRTRGHVYMDKAGEAEVLRHGAERRLSRRSEEIMRELVLHDIREDPMWFAGILARRTWATLTLYKLGAWTPRDGRSFLAATHGNEGVTDNYYQLTDQSDFFRLGAHRTELPLSVVLAPTVLLLLAASLARGSRGPVQDRAGRLAAAGARCRASLPLAGGLALAVLPVPVLITTASAFESETFVLVHLLCAALLADGLAALRAHPRDEDAEPV
jgi:hypothetical protein